MLIKRRSEINCSIGKSLCRKFKEILINLRLKKIRIETILDRSLTQMEIYWHLKNEYSRLH